MRLDRRIALVTLLALTVPFLLGAEQCDYENSLPWRYGRMVLEQLHKLDNRVERLEECECCCDGVLQLVCGSDGRTFVNACEARCAGVHVVAPGECVSDRCGGPDQLTCDPDSFCEQRPGCEDPDAFGICQETPLGCPDVWDPVCGCDGVTYSNDCDRRAAGAALDHPGECREPPEECKTNDDCADREFCAHRAGTCDEVGVCEPRPEACPRIYDPVCGCDGETYSNRCVAASEGVSVARPGMCDRPDFCTNDAQCTEDQFCEFPVCPHLTFSLDPALDPTGPIALGKCVDEPDACPDVWEPVCGCDGVTYSNDCDRRAAGASKLHDGECRDEPRVCGTIAGLVCDDREVCIFEPGRCDWADDAGKCVALPILCTLEYDPVCGCDGKTYSNACAATSNGVSIDHRGTCEPSGDVCGGFAGVACRDGEVCVLPLGECHIADNQGRCETRPQFCLEIYDPVCGCDGVTYSNRCDAVQQGAQIAHEGRCDTREN